MTALLGVALRPAEASDQEVTKPLLGSGQVVGRIHGAKNRVAGNLAIERGDEAREALLAHKTVHVELVHVDDVTFVLTSVR